MARVADQLLVGRAAELAVLDDALSGLRGGSAATLLVQGEPGIGKTRLLAELTARAGAAGCTVLVGSASELERDLPFWVVVDALDDHVGLDPRLVASLPPDVRGELAQVLPSLSDLVPAAAPVLQDERYRVHRAVRELLERLAVRQPVVLVLDDVHWADPASVELVIALLRRPLSGAVLVALGARPRQLDDRLRSALERADRTGGLARLDLPGLSREDAGELLGRATARDRVDRLHLESGGNPFYLQQLARSEGGAARSGRVRSGNGLEAAGVPAAVIASLAEELDLLSADTLPLLRGAAVSGDPFEADLAAAAGGVDEVAARPAIDELLALDLFRPTDVPRRFRFRHPLVRRAVYESAPGGWLLGAHERAAQVLAVQGAPAAARAHHVEYAARHGDDAAVAVFTEAGTSALLRAPASAGRWFSAALRTLPDNAPVEQRVGLLLARARALAAQGRLAESHADLATSLQLAPADAAGLRVQLATACAGVERLLGRHDEAHARLLACLEELPDPEAGDAAALMIELAIDALFRSESEALLTWAGRALAAGRARDERPLVAAAGAIQVLGHTLAGRVTEARAAYDEASALVAAMPDEELAARPDAVAYLCSGATFLDRYDEACTHGERALELGRATGQLHPTLLPALGAAHLMRGRLTQAATVLDDGVEAARLAGITQGLAWMLRNRAWLSLAVGNAAEAQFLADEALELIQRLDESVLSAWAAMTVARACVLTGDAARAVELLAPGTAGRDVLAAIPGVWRAVGFEALATAYSQLGRLEEAQQTAARAEAHAAALGLPVALAWAARARAVVALHAGEPAVAAERALASAAAAESAGVIVEGAISRLLAGRALAAAGQPGPATAALEAAAATFDACGARPHRDAAERELRRLGHTVHRRSQAGTADAHGLAALTGRELEVARLVADRRTNQEIADGLFLSLKTIETHMRNIFRKLNLSSRVELARAVERDGAAPRD